MSSCIVLVCSRYSESRAQVEKYCRPRIEFFLPFISCYSPLSEHLQQASFVWEQSILFWLHNKSLFSKVLDKMAGYRPRFFRVFINLAFIFFHTKTERTWPISNHLELMLGEQHTRGINPIAFLKHCMSLDCPSETGLHQRLSQMLPGLFQFYSERILWFWYCTVCVACH